MASAVQLDNTRTLVLTGASRGIGHATVKKFSAGGWRVITVSRQPFSALCPWPSGDKNHVQLDLAETKDMLHGIEEIRDRLGGGKLDALVNNAAISPKDETGGRLGAIDTPFDLWQRVFNVNFFAPVALARGDGRAFRRARLRRQRDLDRRQPRPSLRRLGLCDLEGRPRRPDARDGA